MRMSAEAKVGLLVLTGLVILVYMSLKVGKFGFGPGAKGYVIYQELENATGLHKDSEVSVAGIPVGRVDAIRLRNGKALLSLRINSDVKISADSTASLRTHGVLGEKYVSIDMGSSGRVLEGGETIRPGPAPGDLDKLLSMFNDIAVDVKAVTTRLSNVLGTPEGEQDLRGILSGLRDAAVSLRSVVDENRNSLRESIANTEALSRGLRDLLETNRASIEETIANSRSFSKTLAERTPAIAENLQSLTADLGSVVVENRQNLQDSLANLKEATGRFSSTLESVDSLVQSVGKGEGTLGKLVKDDSLYTELQASLKDLREVLDRVNRGEGTLGKLLTDENAYAGLTGSLENLKNITDKINRGEGTLGKLITDESVHQKINETLTGVNDFVSGANRFRFELGYRGEYLTRLGEAKNYLELTVRPRQDRFYYLALVDDPRGKLEIETTQTMTTDATGTHAVTEERQVTRDRLKFSAQVGKRFSFLTLRGGVFESTGGVAADLDFLSDQLGFTVEAFDFSRKEGSPHLKLSSRWTFLKNLFVTAGLDDVIDDGRRDYFVGGGIRFLDEDLKYLFSPAASLAK